MVARNNELNDKINVWKFSYVSITHSTTPYESTYTLSLLLSYRTIIELGAERKCGVNVSDTIKTERATVTRTTWSPATLHCDWTFTFISMITHAKQLITKFQNNQTRVATHSYWTPQEACEAPNWTAAAAGHRVRNNDPHGPSTDHSHCSVNT